MSTSETYRLSVPAPAQTPESHEGEPIVALDARQIGDIRAHMQMAATSLEHGEAVFGQFKAQLELLVADMHAVLADNERAYDLLSGVADVLGELDLPEALKERISTYLDLSE